MKKATRTALQVVRAILALIAVLWIISLLDVFMKLGEPGFFAHNWPRVLLAVAVAIAPGWGYSKLTKMLAKPTNQEVPTSK